MEVKPRKAAVVSWIVFDIGPTMFYTGVAGLFFPLWITTELGGDDATVGNTIAVAMALMLVIGPFVGALSDQAQRRMPFLIASTSICIGATLLLGLDDSLGLALGLFGVAMIAMNTADIFYGALLPEVTTQEARGRVSGISVGVGYSGAILAVVLGLTLVEDKGYVFGFNSVAGLFALVSVPLFFLLRERPRQISARSIKERARNATLDLLTNLRGIGRFPDFPRFLLARFWYSWGINTASFFAVLYVTDTVGLSIFETQLILMVGITVAIPSALVWGLIVDRIGPQKTMIFVLVGWLFALGVSAGIPSFDLPAALWWSVGVVSGILIAGVWAADRPFMLRLVPPRYLGQLMGLSSTTGRLAGIIGPFMWGYVAVTLDMGQTASVVILAVCIAVSIFLLRGVRDYQRTDEEIGTPTSHQDAATHV